MDRISANPLRRRSATNGSRRQQDGNNCAAKCDNSGQSAPSMCSPVGPYDFRDCGMGQLKRESVF